MNIVSKGILLPLLIFLTSVSATGNDSDSATMAFDEMKTLVGYWTKKDADNAEFKIHYELTANDTVLVETWLYKNQKHSMTAYHRDGDHLLATHYCPQGNQPRLQMKQVAQSSDIVFEFRDATNLDSLKDSHQHSLRFNLQDKNVSITRGETYSSGKGDETTEFILERIDADAVGKSAK